MIRLLGLQPTYMPYDILEFEYRVSNIPQNAISAVEVSVVWLTEGKGTEDLGVHSATGQCPIAQLAPFLRGQVAQDFLVCPSSFLFERRDRVGRTTAILLGYHHPRSLKPPASLTQLRQGRIG
jgi:hypothetical protein